MNHDQARRIHQATLALLDDPGVRIEHDDIRAMMLANGANQGNAADVVRIPPEMIDDALERAPKNFALADRRGTPRELSATSEPVFWSCPGMSLARRQTHRPFTSHDMADAARLLDQLDNVHGVFGMALDDIPPAARDAVGLNIMARNSSKHLRALCFSPQGADTMVEMKPVVADNAWFSIGFTAHGPLRWTRLALEIFRRTAGHSIPVSINGEPMAGVSGPVTLAGSAAVGNAEILAGLVINQLLEPGWPCIYNLGLAHTFDMKTSIAVTGGPENALFAQLSAMMARFYNLPSASWVSTESMCVDPQAALEKTFGFHTHIDAGVTNIWGVGQLESELTFSPAQAVIDNEIIAYAQRVHRGVNVTDETLAVDLTRSVGIAGSFLDQMHTLENFRTELFDPKLLFRQRREDFKAAGKKPLSERAEDRADELIAAPADPKLTDHQLKALDTLARDLVRKTTQV